VILDVNIEELTKAILALSLFFTTEIEPIEYQELMMHDVNIEDLIKANYQFEPYHYSPLTTSSHANISIQ